MRFPAIVTILLTAAWCSAARAQVAGRIEGRSGAKEAEASQTSEAKAVVEEALEDARTAFRRGLMPLGDFALHVEQLTALHRRLEDPQDGAATWADAARVAAYSEAAARLGRFRQPAARGWAADLAEARLLLERARLATDGGIPTADFDELADRVIVLRVADARVGLGSPLAVARAIEHAHPLEGTVDLTDERREVLASRAEAMLARQVRTGVGRDDELLLARSHLERLAAEPDTETVSAGVDFAVRAYATSLEYHQAGTASLFDVTRAMIAVQDSVAEAPADSLPADVAEELESRRRRLVELAAETRDIRGRNAADVGLVRALEIGWALPLRGGEYEAERQLPKEDDPAPTLDTPTTGGTPDTD